MPMRAPAPAPELYGYSSVRFLGSGGFSDVFVYQQQRPNRAVAVKVLRPDAVNAQTLARFDAEADLMATLSTHPAIVTIHEAGISPDGRPYIVMEFCSQPNLSARYRAERMPTGEVLRIGVQLCGAVETTHRAGILHRDIKPSNVLTTDFHRPVLSDFGISVHRSALGRQTEDAVGLSIPWSPPEAFDARVPLDERADLYSLAATLYTVLAVRSPYDRPGGPNGSADLISRIRSAPLPALSRSDVPPSLERVLARAMDKNPAARYATALDLARALQQVEIEMRLTPTEIDIRDRDPIRALQEIGDSPATRVRALTVIEAQPEHPPVFPTPVPGSAGPIAPRFAAGVGVPDDSSGGAPGRAPGADEQTRMRGWQAGEGMPAMPAAGGRRSRTPLIVVGVAGLLVAGVVAVVLTSGGGTAPVEGPPVDTFQQSTEAPVPVGPASVVGLRGTVRGGIAEFTWTAPDARPGDRYQWKQTGVDDAKATLVAAPPVRISQNAASACISVKVIASDGQASDASVSCVDG